MHYDALIAKMDGDEIIISRIIFNFNFASSSRVLFIEQLKEKLFPRHYSILLCNLLLLLILVYNSSSQLFNLLL